MLPFFSLQDAVTDHSHSHVYKNFHTKLTLRAFFLFLSMAIKCVVAIILIFISSNFIWMNNKNSWLTKSAFVCSFFSFLTTCFVLSFIRTREIKRQKTASSFFSFKFIYYSETNDFFFCLLFDFLFSHKPNSFVSTLFIFSTELCMN